MLRSLLRSDGAEGPFLENSIFEQSPDSLIMREVSLDVPTSFLTQLVATESLSGVSDAKELVESVKGDLDSPHVHIV